MGTRCLDTESCNFHNREKARFCARCGIPLRGTLVQERYEIRNLLNKDRKTVTLNALDQYEGRGVTVRALLSGESSPTEREIFLQDAEMAMSISSHVREAGSIYVTDYGQDGPLAFLVKSEFSPGAPSADVDTFKSHIAAGMSNSVFPSAPPATPAMPIVPSPADHLDELDRDENDMRTQVRVGISKVAPEQVPIAFPASHSLHAKHSPTTRDWLAEGNRAYELARYDEALAAYEAATVQNVVSVEAWSGKGATLLLLGRPEEALLAYDHALSLYPNDPDLWNSRASVLHELRRYDEEMYCYEQALAHDPRYVFAWSGRGMTLAEQG
jgi:tetratricopeptide (TPR) repeat protein